MKKQCLAVLLSASILSVFGEELGFDAALAKLTAPKKDLVYADAQNTIADKPGIRLEKSQMLTTVLKLEPKTRYVLSFSVKGQDLNTDGKGGQILVNNGKHWHRIVTSLKNETEGGTFDWRRGEGIIDTANFTEPETRIMLSCGESGTVWYGDLSLEKGYNDFVNKPSSTVDFREALAKLSSWQKQFMSADTQCRVSDIFSVKVEKNNMLSMLITLAPDTQYELSFFVKGQDLDANGKGGQILINNGKHWQRIVSSPNGEKEGGTFDWRRGKGTIDTGKFTLPETKIYLSCGASGTIWYDKLELKKIEKKADNAAKNSFTLKLFPSVFQNSTTTVCENQTALFSLVGSSSADLSGKAATIFLDIPEFLTCAGVSEKFAPRPEGRKNCPYTVKPIVRDGKPYSHVEITPNEYFLTWFRHHWNWHTLVLDPAENSAGKQGKIYWSVKIGDEIQPEQSCEIRVLKKAEMSTHPCRKFGLWIPRITALSSPLNTRLEKETSDFWSSLSVRRIRQKERDNQEPRVKEKYPGYDLQLNFWDFQFNDPEYKELSKSWPKDVTDKGIVRGNVSSWFQLDDPQWEQTVRKALRKLREMNPDAKSFWSDFEPHPYGYDEGGRMRFAAAMKLDHTPSIAEIQEKYSRQWFAYMVDLHAKLIAKHARLVHEECPGVEFWLCSDPQTAAAPHFSAWCGVDVQRNDPDIDVHNHMPYYSGTQYFDDMAYMMKTVKKPYFPMVDPAERDMDFFLRYTPDKVQQIIVATAANGGAGIGFWPDDVLSGEYLHAIAKGFSMVSSAEEYYDQGKRCEDGFEFIVRNAVSHKLPDGKVLNFPDFSKTIRWTVHEKDGKYLATIFNFDEKRPVIGTIRSKTGKYAPILVKIEANGCVIAGSDLVPEQKTLEKEVASFTGDASMFKDYTQESTTRWAADKQGTPVIYLSQGALRAGIDVCGKCEAVSLLTAENAELLTEGFAGRVMIDGDPLQPPLVFRYAGHGIADGIPYVKAVAEVAPYEGANEIKNPLFRLKIERKFEVKGNSLIITHTFTNPTEQTMHFKGRLNNFPWPGYRFQNENVVLNGKHDASSKADLSWKGKEWDGKPVTLTSGVGGMKEGLSFAPGNGFCGLYSWTQKTKQPRKTVEFMIDREIMPGKTLTLTYEIQSIR